jgi:hypothetical protein
VAGATTRARCFDALGFLAETGTFLLTNDPTDRLTVARDADSLSVTHVIQDIGKIATHMGYGQWQALHTELFSKKNAAVFPGKIAPAAKRP